MTSATLRLPLGLAALMAVLVVTAGATIASTGRLLRATGRVVHVQAVLGAIEGLDGAMSEVESAARAAAATGDSAFGGQLRRASEDARRHLAALSAASVGDSSLIVHEAVVADRVRERLSGLEAAAGAGALSAATSLRGGGASIPARLEGIRTAARLAHERALAEARRLQAATDRLVVIGGVGLLGLAGLGTLMVRRDLAQRRSAEQALAQSEARFRAATDGSLDAFYVLRRVPQDGGAVTDFEFVDVNTRAAALLGHPRALLVGQRIGHLVPANRTSGYIDKYRTVMETGTVLEEEFEVQGEEFRAGWVHHQVVPLVDGVAITSRDITERKRQEEALRALSLVDELTGLYNRRGFMTLAQQQLRLARRGHRDVALLFIDMDDFKSINDTFGHAEGDVALTRAAEILRHTFRDSDIIARLGGDEFVVLATDTASAGTDIIVQRLRQALALRNERDGFPYRLSFTVGAARFDPAMPPSIDELLAAADAMLMEQKRHRRRGTPNDTPAV